MNYNKLKIHRQLKKPLAGKITSLPSRRTIQLKHRPLRPCRKLEAKERRVHATNEKEAWRARKAMIRARINKLKSYHTENKINNTNKNKNSSLEPFNKT